MLASWQSSTRPHWDSSLHEKNAKHGFSSTTVFDISAASDVVAAMRKPGTGALTYSLDPNRDSYKAKDRTLKHLRQVTLFWPEGREATPFVFDLLLHGPLAQPEELVIRIPDVDIRKFLPQPVPGGDRDAARLQAYFEEFSRKTKVIYGARKDNRSLAALPYEQARLQDLNQELGRLAVESGAGATRLRRTRALLSADGAADLAAIEENLRRARAEVAGHPTVEPALERALGTLAALGSARKVSHVRLTDNCREPGNFEISVDDWLGRPAVRGSFALSPDVYEEMLVDYSGLSIGAIGTGLRMSPSVVWSDPIHYWRTLLPWNWLKRFPRVDVADLLPDSAGDETSTTHTAGRIQVARGRIPYEDYEIEVRAKSAFQSFAEPLSYVTVEPSKAMPAGFEPPDRSNADEYWSSARNAGQVVAHKFVFFDDLQHYRVHLSGFEVNGVYKGKSDLIEDDYDLIRKAGRWGFDYSYLTGLQSFEIWEDPAGSVWIRLHGSDHPSRVNVLIGNLQLGIGEAIEYPFGIGTQPLVSDYNDYVYQEKPLYALAYGPDGVVLDHHRLDVGIERIYVERRAPQTYRLRLVAHERIMPVWEGVVGARTSGERHASWR